MADDITRAKWSKEADARKHPPKRALEMALDDIASGKLDPTHIIVVYIVDQQAQPGMAGFYQAGNAGYIERLGILARIAQIMES